MKRYIKCSLEDSYDIVKYYVWKNGEHADSDGFWSYNEALEFAKEIGADEIEATCWEYEDSYEDGKPADFFKIVWKR